MSENNDGGPLPKVSHVLPLSWYMSMMKAIQTQRIGSLLTTAKNKTSRKGKLFGLVELGFGREMICSGDHLSLIHI